MKKLIVVCMALMAMVVGGCGGGDKITVGSVIFEASGEWFVEAIAGMDAAAAKYDVNLVKGDSRYDVAVERDLINEQVKNKAKAIVVCPLTVNESGVALKEVSDMGIPVVTWNTVVKPSPTAQIVVDNKVLGAATGDYLKEYVKKNDIKKLKALYVTDSSFSIGIERCNGFLDSVEPLVAQNILTVAAEVHGHLYEETCVTIEDLLNTQPDINFIWCWNQMTTKAALDTLKRMNRTDVMLAGTDMSMKFAREMLDGNINLIAVTTQQPYEMGYQAVEAAIQAIKGDKPKETITIPTITYTKENKDKLKEYVETHKKFVGE